MKSAKSNSGLIWVRMRDMDGYGIYSKLAVRKKNRINLLFRCAQAVRFWWFWGSLGMPLVCLGSMSQPFVKSAGRCSQS